MSERNIDSLCRNPLFKATFHSGYMNDPSHCDAANAGRRLLYNDEDIDIDHLGHVAVKGVLAAAVLATIAALVLIQLFRKTPQTMIVIGCALPVRTHLLRSFADVVRRLCTAQRFRLLAPCTDS